VRAGLVLLVLVLPTLLALALPWMFFGAHLTSFVPHYNDEIVYWHETLTFTHAGLSGGYYTIDEHPAPFRLSRFGAHGPAFPVLYGSLARAFSGWRLHSAPLVHVGLLTASLGLFLLALRPDARRLALAAALLATFWPLVLMLPSNMQLPLHCALAVVLAACFVRLLGSSDERSAARYRWPGLVLVLAASLVQPTWSLLAFPLLLLPLRRGWWNPIRLATAVLSFVAAVLVFRGLSAPHPDFAVTRVFDPSFTELGRRVATNASNLFSLRAGHPLEVLQHYQVLGFLAVAGATFVRRRTSEAAFHLLNLAPLVLSSIVVYDIWDWRDYRVFAPHLLLSALVVVMGGSRAWLVRTLLISNLLFAPYLAAAFREFAAPYFATERAALEAFRSEIAALHFEPGADPWCNTLLTNLFTNGDDPRLLAVPAGFGISYLYERPRPPVRSRYLLLGADWQRRQQRFVASLDLEWLAATRLGDLYRNRRAACGSP
jgi:hypothetical protein